MLPAAAAFTLVRNRARARRKRPRKGLWHGSWPSRAQASSGTGQPQPGLAMPLLRDQEGWQGARHSGLPPAQPAGLHRRGRALPPSRPARWYHGAAGSTGKLRSLRASAVPGCWRRGGGGPGRPHSCLCRAEGSVSSQSCRLRKRGPRLCTGRQDDRWSEGPALCAAPRTLLSAKL